MVARGKWTSSGIVHAYLYNVIIARKFRMMAMMKPCVLRNEMMRSPAYTEPTAKPLTSTTMLLFACCLGASIEPLCLVDKRRRSAILEREVHALLAP